MTDAPRPLPELPKAGLELPLHDFTPYPEMIMPVGREAVRAAEAELLHHSHADWHGALADRLGDAAPDGYEWPDLKTRIQQVNSAHRIEVEYPQAPGESDVDYATDLGSGLAKVAQARRESQERAGESKEKGVKEFVESLKDLKRKDPLAYGMINDELDSQVKHTVTTNEKGDIEVTPRETDNTDRYHQGDLYYDLMKATQMSPHLIRRRAEDMKAWDDQFTWTEWLSEVATEDDVLNFLQWNEHRLEVLNTDTDVRFDLEETRRKFINSAEDLYRQGYLSHDLWSMPTGQLQRSSMIIGDPIKMALAMHARGFTDVRGRNVTIAPNVIQGAELNLNRQMSAFYLDGESWVIHTAADLMAALITDADRIDLNYAKSVLRNPNKNMPVTGEAVDYLADEKTVKAFMNFASVAELNRDSARVTLDRLLSAKGKSLDRLKRIVKNGRSSR
jgi:hypothetical protein